MKRKLLILTEIIAPYRIPVFSALAAREEIDLHVIFLSETDASLRQWRVYREEIQFPYEVLKSFRCRIGQLNVLLNTGVSAALDRARPDLIVAGGYNYRATWQAQRWARRRKVPFLLWSESNAADARSNLWPAEVAKRRFIRSCQGYIVPGKSAAEYLEGFGVPGEQIFSAPNAVDVERFAKNASEARQDATLPARLVLPDRYLLYVGRFVKSKGIFDLLSAYAKLPEEARQTVGLVFAGDGEEREELLRQSRKITGRILFPGFVQRDDLAAFYAWAEALVFPTHSDPWGLVVNEAMACGLPIIATDVAGCTADLVHDGVNGYVVRASEPAQLSAAMLKLLQDSELREKMSEASATMSRSFTPQIWAEGVAHAVINVGAIRE